MEEWDELVPSNSTLKNIHLVYFLLGSSITIFGAFSLIIKDKLHLSEATVAILIGIVIGPVCLNIFDPSERFTNVPFVLLEVSRARKSLFIALGPLMIGAWVISSLGFKFIFNLSWNDAFLLGACVTPTDPVLASSIVQGEYAEHYIPKHVRLLISAESAGNDGLGLSFIFLPLYLSRLSSPQEGLLWWFLKVVCYQVLLSIIIGVLIGIGARELLKTAHNRHWVDKESILGSSVALTFMIIGALSLMGSDDILASYAAGLALSWDEWFNQQIKESKIQEVVDTVLNFSYFILVGTVIPWKTFGSSIPIWQYILGSIWVLFLRRLPVTIALYKWIPALNSTKEAVFFGWFGPMGATALYYCLVYNTALNVPTEPFFSIVCFVILSSVLVHGISVSFFHLAVFKNPLKDEMGQGTIDSLSA